MAESLNMKSMQLKIDGEYIVLDDISLASMEIDDDCEVYDGSDFFGTNHDLSSGSLSLTFKTKLEGMPRIPKSKKRRIQKKYVKRWLKFWEPKTK